MYKTRAKSLSLQFRRGEGQCEGSQLATCTFQPPTNSLMKATAQPLTPVAVSEKSWLAVYAELFKARLTFLVLLTTLVGFYIGYRGPVNYWLMLHTVLGTALVASAASAFNQLLERDYDARMLRTKDRPLPSGRLQPNTV